MYAGKAWDKYDVSDNGEIRNAETKHVLKATQNSNGYMMIVVRPNGRASFKGVIVHRAVAETFIPNANGYKQVNHIDGDKHNNAVSNLEWCNQSMNMKHAFAHGLMNNSRFRGQGAYGSKLKEEDIIEIRKLCDERKFTKKRIAEMYNCSLSNIKLIAGRKTWYWLE